MNELLIRMEESKSKFEGMNREEKEKAFIIALSEVNKKYKVNFVGLRNNTNPQIKELVKKIQSY